MRAPTLEELDEACMRASLYEFLKAGFPHLEPDTPFVDNWHLELMCDEVQAAVTSPTGADLLVNVPPGTMKSLVVSVFLPAWVWLQRPSWRAIYASANPRVSLRDSMRCRDVIEGEWYQNTFKPTWSLAVDQNAKSLFGTTEGGFRSAVSVGSKVTGDRADALFVDDPLDAADAFSPVEREKVLVWWANAFRNRVASPTRAVRVVIMQRLHEDDLSGYLLKQGGWRHVCLRMEFELDDAEAHPRDPRTQAGELLFPARFPQEVLAGERKTLMGGYAGQMQQRPTAAEGGLFKREHWRWWNTGVAGVRPKGCNALPAVLLPRFPQRVILSVDATFKGTENTDFVTIGCWVCMGPDRFLAFRVKRRMTFTETCAEIRRCRKAAQQLGWKGTPKIIVEDKANGPAIIDTLSKEFSGVIPVTPEGGKEARAGAIQGQVESGNVYLPENDPTVHEYVDEHAGFPKGKHDDEVDQTSQALLYLDETDGMRRARDLSNL